MFDIFLSISFNCDGGAKHDYAIKYLKKKNYN